MQQRQPLAKAVHGGDRRIRVGNPDVHVKRALRGALDEPLHLPLDALVALRLDELHVEELGIRMKPDGHDSGPARARAHRLCPPLPELRDRLRDRAGRLRADLDLREEGLVVDPVTRKFASREDLVRNMRQLEGLCVDDEQLLLEPDREGLALAEAVGRRGAA